VDDGGRPFQGRIYERHLLFLGLDEDTSFVLPVFFSARTSPEGVERRVRGWLLREEGEWETLFSDRWTGSSSRAPWRILPRGPLRIVVGEGDALKRIHLDEEGIPLVLEMGSGLEDWSTPEGDLFLLHEGTVRLGEEARSGMVLDLTRSRGGTEREAGDWAVLVSGDSLALVLEAPSRGEGQGKEVELLTVYGRLDFRDLRWTEVRLEGTEIRSYQPARREIPFGWRLSTPAEELVGAFASTSATLEAGEGEGAVRPVEGLFAVEGRIRVEGRDYPVVGFFHYRRR